MKSLKLFDQQVQTQSLWVAGIICLFVAVFDLLGLSKAWRSLGEKLTQPFLSSSKQAVQLVIAPYLRARHAFKAAKKIQDLELKYAEASSQLAELAALKKENAALKAMLNNSDRDLTKVLIAAPILSLANPAVGVGESDGVLLGQMVLANGVLLGTIDQVYTHHSLVKLLYQENARPILAKSEHEVQGLVKGDGRQILFTEIPMAASLEIGEKVTSLGQEGIDKDVFIGRVVAIKAEPSSLVKTAVLDQLISFHELALVEVK